MGLPACANHRLPETFIAEIAEPLAAGGKGADGGWIQICGDCAEEILVAEDGVTQRFGGGGGGGRAAASKKHADACT
eukprot:1984395-Prymnesium_polylepis.1